MGVPAGPEHSLAQDQVDVPWLADSETDPQVHLRPYRASAHGLLRRPQSRCDQGDATARPSRAMESVSAIAPRVSSASSAYSSMMTISAGMSGDISHVRLPAAASNAATAFPQKRGGSPGSRGEPVNARLPRA